MASAGEEAAPVLGKPPEQEEEAEPRSYMSMRDISTLGSTPTTAQVGTLRAANTASLEEIKKLARGGIPPDLRGQIWMLTSGAASSRKPGLLAMIREGGGGRARR